LIPFFVVVLSIDLLEKFMNPQELNSLHLLSRLIRQAHEHKGHAGKVLIIGGAPGMAGSVLLSGRAALHAGAGWVMIGFLDEHAISVLSDQAELMLSHASREMIEKAQADVLAIGPGLGQSEKARDLLSDVLQSSALMVIDADGLNLIAGDAELMKQLKTRPSLSTVITPHPGEAAKLLNTTPEQIQIDRSVAIDQLVALTGAITVLKGQHTLIKSPQLNEATQVCFKGHPGMGVAGMGDVLTGVIAAIMSQGIKHHINPFEASCLAVELHATAADSLLNQGVGPIGLTPSEVIKEIRNLINIK
jgi:ADP-dependent NAD(P)H-hydrate dehydratase / NAD(P)H-hydrate epimerase